MESQRPHDKSKQFRKRKKLENVYHQIARCNYKATTIRDWYEDRHTGEWSRRESSNVDPVRHPAIWSSIILHVSMRIFSMGLTFTSADRGKQIALPNVGGPHPSSWRTDWNKKADTPLSKRWFHLFDCLWTRTLLFFSPLDLNLYISYSWVLNLTDSRQELCHWLLCTSSLPAHPEYLQTR